MDMSGQRGLHDFLARSGIENVVGFRHNPWRTAPHGKQGSGPGFPGGRAESDCRRVGRRERETAQAAEKARCVARTFTNDPRPPPATSRWELPLVHLCARVYFDPYAAYNPREAVECHGEASLEMQLHHFRNVASSARHLPRTAPKLSSRGTVLRRAKFSQSNRFHPREARLARILHTDSLAARI